MQVVTRDRDYADLVGPLLGKKVLIWTCDTCARMCDIGGIRHAEELGKLLRYDGIKVIGARSCKASCVFSSVLSSQDCADEDFDVVLALTCDAGARVASEVFGRPVLNPVATLGTGYRGRDGTPVLMDRSSGEEVALDEAARRSGLGTGPFSL